MKKTLQTSQHRIKTGAMCYLMSAKIHSGHPYRIRIHLGWDMIGFST